MTRTPAQQLGIMVLLATNQPERFTGRISLTLDYYSGSLKECTDVIVERRIDLRRLNESNNKTIDKSESISYIPSNA